MSLKNTIRIFLFLGSFFRSYSMDDLPIGSFSSSARSSISLPVTQAHALDMMSNHSDDTLTTAVSISPLGQAEAMRPLEMRAASCKYKILGAAISAASCACGVYLVTQDQEQPSSQQILLELTLISAGLGGLAYNTCSMLNTFRHRLRASDQHASNI